jgi:hypothetical protein
MGSDHESKLIAAVIATFPATFGLRAFPGEAAGDLMLSSMVTFNSFSK